MAKCNLAPELRGKYLHQSELWVHSDEELEACRRYFENYLFCDKAEIWADPDNDFPDDTPTKAYHCTACGARFLTNKNERPEYFKLKHNEGTRCPDCGRVVTVKLLGKVREGLNLSKSEAITFINIANNGAVCLDSCIVFYDYNGERNPAEADMIVSCISKRRYYMEQGAVMEWRRSLGSFSYTPRTDKGGWEEATNVQEPFQRNGMYGYDGFGYLIGLDKLEKSQLRYSAVVKYFADYHNLDITNPSTPVRLFVKYMAEYAMNNRVEIAVKLGLSAAVGELVRDGRKNAQDLDWRAETPADFVRLTKEDAKLFFANPSIVKLSWYHKLNKLDAIKSMREAEFIAARVGFCRIEAAQAAIKYELTLCALASRMGDGQTLNMWTDYINMGETLNYDFSRRDVLLPKDLRERHDAAAKAIQIKNNREKVKKYQRRRKSLEKKYSYTCDGLSIVVPRGIEDIVQEGRTLGICVGGYAHRHVEGKTTILFLRHERRPERSWICIELDDRGEIQQIHGYRNEGYPHAVAPEKKYREWLTKWQKWYKNGSPRDSKGLPIIKEKRMIA